MTADEDARAFQTDRRQTDGRTTAYTANVHVHHCASWTPEKL